MNIALWVLQFLLALHTIVGAVWKFSHSVEQTMPSLKAIPQPAWLGMSVVEVLCALALVAPIVIRPLATLARIAAVCIAAEMLLFTALHLASGDKTLGPVVYWLVVAIICASIAYGRFAMSPLK